MGIKSDVLVSFGNPLPWSHWFRVSYDLVLAHEKTDGELVGKISLFLKGDPRRKQSVLFCQLPWYLE